MNHSNNMSKKNIMMSKGHPSAPVISDRITTGPSSSEAPEATIYESVRSDRNTTRSSNGLEATVHKKKRTFQFRNNSIREAIRLWFKSRSSKKKAV